MTQPNTIVVDEAALNAALACAKGSYQEGILHGRFCLSGADLKGKASEYAGRYQQSMHNLFARMSAKGVPFCEITGKHNKRILVLGTDNKKLACMLTSSKHYKI